MIVVLSEAVNKIFGSFTVIEARFGLFFYFMIRKKIKQISTFFGSCLVFLPDLNLWLFFTELMKAPVSLSTENFALIGVIH